MFMYYMLVVKMLFKSNHPVMLNLSNDRKYACHALKTFHVKLKSRTDMLISHKSRTENMPCYLKFMHLKDYLEHDS